MSEESRGKEPVPGFTALGGEQAALLQEPPGQSGRKAGTKAVERKAVEYILADGQDAKMEISNDIDNLSS